jgi:hypothetical protein
VAEGWFNGPPYAVAEHVFDEYSQHPCAFDAEGIGEGDGETYCFSDPDAGGAGAGSALRSSEKPSGLPGSGPRD